LRRPQTCAQFGTFVGDPTVGTFDPLTSGFAWHEIITIADNNEKDTNAEPSFLKSKTSRRGC
jgi:hypothetical protein